MVTYPRKKGDDVKKIVDLSEAILRKKNAAAKKALTALQETKDPDAIIKVILDVIVAECEIALGLIELDDDDIVLDFFDQVNSVYQEAAGDCYFCCDLDPNEIKFEKSTPLCMTCKMKMRNFLRAIGIDPGKVLVGMK